MSSCLYSDHFSLISRHSKRPAAHVEILEKSGLRLRLRLRLNFFIRQRHWSDMMSLPPEDDELPVAVSHQLDTNKEVSSNFQAPFTILNKYRSQLKRLSSDRHGDPSKTKHLEKEKINNMGGNTLNSQVLSSVSIMRMAEMEVSHSTSQKTGDFSTLAKAFGIEIGLIRKHTMHLKSLLLLLDAAEKYSNQQYDQAENLLVFVPSESHFVHPIEKVITCFGRCLRERIDIRKGKIDLEKVVVHVDVEEAIRYLQGTIHVCEQELPFCQISHFTAIQTILDAVASAERIHFIDIGLKVGSYWIVMMDALANRKHCRLEQLKITVVCRPMENVEEAGKLLSSFAESMNLPFAFKILYSEIHELDKDKLELKAGEIVAVYLEFCLVGLSNCPKNLEALLRGLKALNPDLMVFNDAEANTCSSSTFVDRFKDALFLCSALFDSHQDCMKLDNHFYDIMQKIFFQEIISNGILIEDDGTFNQCRKIDFWREYFAKFGIVETELSQQSVCQASLMVRESPCWRCCTLSTNGKSMLIGWNGVPLRSVSAWKFQQDCEIGKDQTKKS